jgi:hypothetical protein
LRSYSVRQTIGVGLEEENHVVCPYFLARFFDGDLNIANNCDRNRRRRRTPNTTEPAVSLPLFITQRRLTV